MPTHKRDEEKKTRPFYCSLNLCVKLTFVDEVSIKEIDAAVSRKLSGKQLLDRMLFSRSGWMDTNLKIGIWPRGKIKIKRCGQIKLFAIAAQRNFSFSRSEEHFSRAAEKYATRSDSEPSQ